MTTQNLASPWVAAGRARRLAPSAIWEHLKLSLQPGVISLAGGLPSADTFPVEEIRQAAERVMRTHARDALQYATSAGYEPLRDWVAERMDAQGLSIKPSQVMITTGSQQGLDLVAKVLVDPGSRIAVESPTYAGALQAFAPYEPELVAVACDRNGPLPDELSAARGARFLYALPSFQNPSGRCMDNGRRDALVAAAKSIHLPIVEDDPYGDLWPDGTIYLGSFSKVLAPGLRLGYLIAPEDQIDRLLHVKQGADLHTPIFTQRIVHEVIRNGFLDQHLVAVRARYRAQRDVMQAALQTHLPPHCQWQAPGGGMFFWIELPDGIDAAALLPDAAARGVVFVPGASFYAGEAKANTLRLSFATASSRDIQRGVAQLGRLLAQSTES